MTHILCGPKFNRVRRAGTHDCNKKCKHWTKCWKFELGNKEEPVGFTEKKSDRWNLELDNFHINYKNRKVTWVMRKKAK
jgi:hypothetical protein